LLITPHLTGKGTFGLLKSNDGRDRFLRFRLEPWIWN